MDVTFQTQSGIKTTLRLSPETTIQEAKKRLEAAAKIPARNIDLVHDQRLISETKTINELSLSQNSVISIRCKKSLCQVQPKIRSNPERTSNPLIQPCNLQRCRRNTNNINYNFQHIQRSMPMDKKSAKICINCGIQSLYELGFPKHQCQQALLAAGFNIDRAAEYLLNGNTPESLFTVNSQMPFNPPNGLSKESCEKLMNQGYNISQIYQVCEACDNDLDLVSQCLCTDI